MPKPSVPTVFAVPNCSLPTSNLQKLTVDKQENSFGLLVNDIIIVA